MALPQLLRMVQELKGTLVTVMGKLVPSGVILMWSGSTDTIPAGWALCNGQDGTPDLTDRFILGAGKTYQPGATGGAATATPNVAAGNAKTGVSLSTAAPGGTAGKATTGIGVQNAALSIWTGAAGTGIGIQGTTLDVNTLPLHLHQVVEYAGVNGTIVNNHIKASTNGDTGNLSGYAGASWAHAHGVSDPGAALADLAAEKNYCRPEIDDSFCFDVEDGRHPVVEASLAREHGGAFVGNDCRLGGDYSNIWLITGPNMAGKSTFLRQNAIIAVMAQIGSFVPAKRARIGVVNKLFSRVGASDDLARGRSTFMVEMVETASILNRADERSLVILDEIGRGTATFDGLSIAWAVVEHLHEVNRCRALFATHYHELTSLVGKLHKMSLHCMKIKEFNDEVIFLHEVIDGAADRSYGIHVAKLAGLPPVVLKRAEQVLSSLENDKKNANIKELADDLPLFSSLKKEEKKPSAVDAALAEICPDNLTPREALDELYRLKALSEEN